MTYLTGYYQNFKLLLLWPQNKGAVLKIHFRREDENLYLLIFIAERLPAFPAKKSSTYNDSKLEILKLFM